jgi:vacuolar-type H+-ATPase subunit H
VDILYLLDRLEELLSSARRVPLSAHVMIDPQECLDVVDQIRLTLPEELKLARRVVAERDQIISDARESADRLVERAEEQAAQRADEHALVRTAQERAHALLEQAQREAQETREEANAYAYRVFASLQKRIRQIEEVVVEGLAAVRPSSPSGE